jgi:hypothetical protein
LERWEDGGMAETIDDKDHTGQLWNDVAVTECRALF